MKRLSTRLLIRPGDIPASRPDFEVIGSFNPGAVRFHKEVLLLVRVAERPRERREGYTALPRSEGGELVVDWMPNDELIAVDPRVVRCRATGLVRLTFVSHLRLVRCGDGTTVESLGPPLLSPMAGYEELGVEDPRITELDGRFYITYVAVSRSGPATALASTRDFQKCERHGIIFCPENKDVVLFPGKFDDAYHALHRPVGATPFARPQMWSARSLDLIHWGEHRFVYGGDQVWESGRVGAGTPPLLLPEGWLELYHGNERSEAPGKVGAYCGAAMLLAKDDPARVLRVGKGPILRPEIDFECEGFVNQVVFPTGLIEADDRLLVYYGASDQYTAVVEFSRRELVGELMST